MKDYYGEIDRAITAYENYKYVTKPISWITDRIAWCWKFRHITETEKNELCDRIIDIMERKIK